MAFSISVRFTTVDLSVCFAIDLLESRGASCSPLADLLKNEMEKHTQQQRRLWISLLCEVAVYVVWEKVTPRSKWGDGEVDKCNTWTFGASVLLACCACYGILTHIAHNGFTVSSFKERFANVCDAQDIFLPHFTAVLFTVFVDD